MNIMHFMRYAKNSQTLISWSMRRDSFKPIQCFIDKEFTIPKSPETVCDCITYCKHSPRPGGEMSYNSIQAIDNTVYSVTPIKVELVNKENVVMYL